MESQNLLQALVTQAGAKTVYGEPVSIDGRVIVPVATVRCGFGGGSGKNSRDRNGEGGGGGGGFVAKPVGFVEVSSQGARFVPIIDVQSVAFSVGLGILVGLLLGKMTGGK